MVGHLSAHPAGVLAGVVQGPDGRSGQGVGQAQEGRTGDRGRGQAEEVVANLRRGLQRPRHHVRRHRVHPWSGGSTLGTVRLAPPERNVLN